MNRNIIIAILGICLAAGVAIGLYNIPQDVPVPPQPIVDNNETEVIIDVENNTDIVDNNTIVVDNQTVVPDEEFKHNFSKFTLLK